MSETQEAGTLNCPMCGAPQAAEATQCDHCGAPLATVACPSCFGLIFKGAKFCSHCGAKVEQPAVETDTKLPCPHCRINLDAKVLGGAKLSECGKCEGVWVDTATFADICADRVKQASVLGLAAPLADTGNEDFEAVHYFPCPVCQSLMNRVNFAQCSHIIVDLCMQHGTWFDKDELRKVVEFIRAGGLDKSRAREIERLEQERSLAKYAQTGGGAVSMDLPDTPQQRDGYDIAFDVLGAALRGLFKL